MSQSRDESSAFSEEDDEEETIDVGGGGGDDGEGDNHSSTNGSTTLGDTSHDSFSKRSRRSEKFTKKESRYVLYLRLLVLAILFLAAIAVCLVVFIVTTNGEEESFDSHFEAASEKVSDHFMNIATEKMAAAGSLVVAIVAHGIALDDSWPFVTLSSFQERAATVKRLSGALYIGIDPVVRDTYREAWENYSTTSKDAMWYEEGRAYQQQLGFDDLDNRPQVRTDDPRLDLDSGVANYIYDFHRDTTGKGVISPKADWYLPVWQTSPVTKRSMVNQNRASNSKASIKALEENAVVFEGMQHSEPGFGSDDNPLTAEIAWLLRLANQRKTKYEGDIFSTVYFPLYDRFEGNRTTVGVMRIVIHWARFFRDVLPDSTRGIVFVLENGCDAPYTYQIDGRQVLLVGHGDLHDPKYDGYLRYASFRNVSSIADGTRSGLKLSQQECAYAIRIYPSDSFSQEYHTNTPMVITVSVAIVFILTVLLFFVYDCLVERRQKILLDKATRTHQIVASLFPKHVRDQILHNDDNESKKKGHLLNKTVQEGEEVKTSSAASRNDTAIADLYPESSILFADIAGFTAWSSSREPQQVFILLQNVFHAFDAIAKKRKVFKVETVGDSYVAAAGVPEPQPTHAVIMARFAWECLVEMKKITRNLESVLGPDTGELTMRFGIHSGPVTAGVLRGERSRFQLFGDTVNTASRMESTGIKGKIQCSQSTAEALIIAGKDHWLKPREGAVEAKGKGILKTYWVIPHNKCGSQSAATNDTGASNQEELEFHQEVRADSLLKRERQVDWITEILSEYIRLIVAKQEVATSNKPKCTLHLERIHGHIPMDEVVDVIKLPDFNAKAFSANNRSVQIPEQIRARLRQYVSIIASAYQDNPFHNFEHACHVTMAVSKFMKRIVSPDLNLDQVNKLGAGKKFAAHLHDFSHGINSDPVTQLAVILSALIHDVDHRGISNVQLGKENPAMAKRYRDKSLAEQNSFEISWDLFLSDHFKQLREFIFTSPDELVRFRQIVVNVVLATDIFDKELNELRKNRWARAFSESPTTTDREVNQFRATVVLEHIMQASDVCHLMQHWHVYQKFNRKLFHELLLAHRAGRMGVDPATFWYKGEIAFFDNYIIPLAKKLQECRVFGVSSDECLNYALRNREEWEHRGQEIVAMLVEEFAER